MTKPILAEGKTKIVRASQVEMFMKDDITAGDGKRHEIISSKGRLCNTVNTNVFQMLENNEVATTFVRWLTPQSFLAEASTMILLEVVNRFEKDGSYLQRHPEAKKGEPFSSPIVEFYLKASNNEFKGIPVPGNDPYVSGFDSTGIWVCDAHKPEVPRAQATFIPAEKIYPPAQSMYALIEIAGRMRQIGTLLHDAWAGEGCRLVDFKGEFDDCLRLSDVLTPDEWRVFDEDGNPLSKQPFRDGASIEEMRAIYEEAARRSEALIRYKE